MRGLYGRVQVAVAPKIAEAIHDMAVRTGTSHTWVVSNLLEYAVTNPRKIFHGLASRINASLGNKIRHRRPRSAKTTKGAVVRLNMYLAEDVAEKLDALADVMGQRRVDVCTLLVTTTVAQEAWFEQIVDQKLQLERA